MVCVGVDAYLNANFVLSTNIFWVLFFSLWLGSMSKCAKFQDKKATLHTLKLFRFVLFYYCAKIVHTTIEILSNLPYLRISSLCAPLTHIFLSISHPMCIMIIKTQDTTNKFYSRSYFLRVCQCLLEENTSVGGSVDGATAVESRIH